MKELESLAAISRLYGSDNNFVIAGGGNTSYKNEGTIWVKSSGTSLATLQVPDLAVLDRKKLKIISEKKYSEDIVLREEEVKQDLAAATITKDKRPSVETSIHNVINYPFIVHLHPTLVNGLMCASQAEMQLQRLFGENVFFIPYTDPGYVLFKKIEEKIEQERSKSGEEPQVIWLQNHGIFVGGNDTEEVEKIYTDIMHKISDYIKSNDDELIAPDTMLFDKDTVNSVIKLLQDKGAVSINIRNSQLIQNIFHNEENIKAVAKPFIPDQIVYCKSGYIFIDENDANIMLGKVSSELDEYYNKHSYLPKVVVIKGIGLITLGNNDNDCNIIADVFEDAIKIASISKFFGGPHPMTDEQIYFIENWEVENYRRKVAATAD